MTNCRALAVVLILFLTISTTGCFLSGTSSDNRPNFSYRVKSGDTLQAIGQRFNVPSGELAKLNGISDPKSLQVGLVLQVPPRDGKQLKRMLALAAQSPSSSDRASLGRVSLRGVKGYLGKLRAPVVGAKFSSPFGWRSGKFHEGVDLAAPQGSKIYAAHGGTVVFESNRFYGYGKIVVIKGEGLITVYAHNNRNRVSTGESVRAGEWIADVGRTGEATGNHVHFETRVQDESGNYAAVDPARFIPGFGGQLAQNEGAGTVRR